MQAVAERIYRFDGFQLDPLKRQLLRDGEPVPLNPKAFDLLFALVQHSGQLLTKDDLFQLVWHNQIVEDSNLTVTMSAIRKALGEKASQPRYIATVSGEGYRFVGDVRVVGGEMDLVVERRGIARIVIEQETEEDSSDRSSETTARTASRYPSRQIAAAVLTIAVISGIAYIWIKSPRQLQNLPAGVPAFQSASIRRLTTIGNVSTATLSPDGKLFIYSLNEKGQYSLWLGHTDGGEPIRLRETAEASYDSLNFAPDSSGFYYVLREPRKFRGDLYKSPLFGGAPEKLREDVPSAITFSPDFARFAFVQNGETDDRSSIMIAKLAPESGRELASRPLSRAFNPRSLSWSPDGQTIAASAIADDESSAEILTVSVTGGSITQHTGSLWNNVRATTWLKDGSELLVVAQDKDSYDAAQLWLIPVSGGIARPLNPDVNTYGSALTVSADGLSLLALQTQGNPNVWVTPADDLGRAKQITFGSFGRRDGWVNLDWTRDGKLLYGAFVGKSLTIWSMGAEGEDPKQMTSAGYLDQHLNVSADGRVIVFQSNRSGSDEIWQMNDGGDLQQLTKGGNNTQPSIAPDGRLIVFKGRDKSLWRMNLDGGDSRRLTERAASDPRISPDGGSVACGYQDEGRLKLAVLSIDTGEPLQLFDVPTTSNFSYGIRWTPDGDAVTYRDWYNGIWKQPLAGGEPSRLAGLPEEKLFSYAWSRDGKQFAYVRGPEIRDVVLIQSTPR